MLGFYDFVFPAPLILITLPVATSQNLMVVSQDQEMINLPSGLNAALRFTRGGHCASGTATLTLFLKPLNAQGVYCPTEPTRSADVPRPERAVSGT